MSLRFFDDYTAVHGRHSTVSAGTLPEAWNKVSRQNHCLKVQLTPREDQVLRMLAMGCPNKEIASGIHVSQNTVKYHLKNLYGKLGVSRRTEAAMAASRLGLLHPL